MTTEGSYSHLLEMAKTLAQIESVSYNLSLCCVYCRSHCTLPAIIHYHGDAGRKYMYVYVLLSNDPSCGEKSLESLALH